MLKFDTFLSYIWGMVFQHFMQTVSNKDNLHKISNFYFLWGWGGESVATNLFSVEFAQ